MNIWGNIRVSWAVGAAGVAASWARLVTRYKELVALAAVAAEALAWLLIHQVLAARLGRLGELNWLVGVIPVGDDGRILLLLLQERRAALAGGLLLGIATLGRVARALLAADVLAAGALLGGAKVGVALVAGAVDAHADGLVDAQRIALGRVPLADRDFDAKTLAEAPCALLVQLQAGHLCGVRVVVGGLLALIGRSGGGTCCGFGVGCCWDCRRCRFCGWLCDRRTSC